MKINNQEVMVLLSGGIDSTALVRFYIKMRRTVCALFVNYGQPPVNSEFKSAKLVSKFYSVPLKTVKYVPVKNKHAGYIPGRNAFLLSVALMERESHITTVALGIHSGTDYCDCKNSFIRKMQNIFDIYDGRIKISAPFINFNKAEIFQFCKDEKIPIELTHSCESSDKPCGKCLSCKDKQVLEC